MSSHSSRSRTYSIASGKHKANSLAANSAPQQASAALIDAARSASSNQADPMLQKVISEHVMRPVLQGGTIRIGSSYLTGHPSPLAPLYSAFPHGISPNEKSKSEARTRSDNFLLKCVPDLESLFVGSPILPRREGVTPFTIHACDAVCLPNVHHHQRKMLVMKQKAAAASSVSSPMNTLVKTTNQQQPPNNFSLSNLSLTRLQSSLTVTSPKSTIAGSPHGTGSSGPNSNTAAATGNPTPSSSSNNFSMFSLHHLPASAEDIALCNPTLLNPTWISSFLTSYGPPSGEIVEAVQELTLASMRYSSSRAATFQPSLFSPALTLFARHIRAMSLDRPICVEMSFVMLRTVLMSDFSEPVSKIAFVANAIDSVLAELIRMDLIRTKSSFVMRKNGEYYNNNGNNNTKNNNNSNHRGGSTSSSNNNNNNNANNNTKKNSNTNENINNNTNSSSSDNAPSQNPNDTIDSDGDILSQQFALQVTTFIDLWGQILVEASAHGTSTLETRNKLALRAVQNFLERLEPVDHIHGAMFHGGFSNPDDASSLQRIFVSLLMLDQVLRYCPSVVESYIPAIINRLTTPLLSTKCRAVREVATVVLRDVLERAFYKVEEQSTTTSQQQGGNTTTNNNNNEFTTVTSATESSIPGYNQSAANFSGVASPITSSNNNDYFVTSSSSASGSPANEDSDTAFNAKLSQQSIKEDQEAQVQQEVDALVRAARVSVRTGSDMQAHGGVLALRVLYVSALKHRPGYIPKFFPRNEIFSLIQAVTRPLAPGSSLRTSALLVLPLLAAADVQGFLDAVADSSLFHQPDLTSVMNYVGSAYANNLSSNSKSSSAKNNKSSKDNNNNDNENNNNKQATAFSLWGFAISPSTSYVDACIAASVACEIWIVLDTPNLMKYGPGFVLMKSHNFKDYVQSFLNNNQTRSNNSSSSKSRSNNNNTNVSSSSGSVINASSLNLRAFDKLKGCSLILSRDEIGQMLQTLTKLSMREALSQRGTTSLIPTHLRFHAHWLALSLCARAPDEHFPHQVFHVLVEDTCEMSKSARVPSQVGDIHLDALADILSATDIVRQQQISTTSSGYGKMSKTRLFIERSLLRHVGVLFPQSGLVPPPHHTNFISGMISQQQQVQQQHMQQQQQFMRAENRGKASNVSAARRRSGSTSDDPSNNNDSGLLSARGGRNGRDDDTSSQFSAARLDRSSRNHYNSHDDIDDDARSVGAMSSRASTRFGPGSTRNNHRSHSSSEFTPRGSGAKRSSLGGSGGLGERSQSSGPTVNQASSILYQWQMWSVSNPKLKWAAFEILTKVEWTDASVPLAVFACYGFNFLIVHGDITLRRAAINTLASILHRVVHQMEVDQQINASILKKNAAAAAADGETNNNNNTTEQPQQPSLCSVTSSSSNVAKKLATLIPQSASKLTLTGHFSRLANILLATAVADFAPDIRHRALELLALPCFETALSSINSIEAVIVTLRDVSLPNRLMGTALLSQICSFCPGTLMPSMLKRMTSILVAMRTATAMPLGVLEEQMASLLQIAKSMTQLPGAMFASLVWLVSQIFAHKDIVSTVALILGLELLSELGNSFADKEKLAVWSRCIPEILPLVRTDAPMKLLCATVRTLSIIFRAVKGPVENAVSVFGDEASARLVSTLQKILEIPHEDGDTVSEELKTSVLQLLSVFELRVTVRHFWGPNSSSLQATSSNSQVAAAAMMTAASSSSNPYSTAGLHLLSSSNTPGMISTIGASSSGSTTTSFVGGAGGSSSGSGSTFLHDLEHDQHLYQALTLSLSEGRAYSRGHWAERVLNELQCLILMSVCPSHETAILAANAVASILISSNITASSGLAVNQIPSRELHFKHFALNVVQRASASPPAQKSTFLVLLGEVAEKCDNESINFLLTDDTVAALLRLWTQRDDDSATISVAVGGYSNNNLPSSSSAADQQQGVDQNASSASAAAAAVTNHQSKSAAILIMYQPLAQLFSRIAEAYIRTGRPSEVFSARAASLAAEMLEISSELAPSKSAQAQQAVISLLDCINHTLTLCQRFVTAVMLPRLLHILSMDAPIEVRAKAANVIVHRIEEHPGSVEGFAVNLVTIAMKILSQKSKLVLAALEKQQQAQARALEQQQQQKGNNNNKSGKNNASSSKNSTGKGTGGFSLFSSSILPSNANRSSRYVTLPSAPAIATGPGSLDSVINVTRFYELSLSTLLHCPVEFAMGVRWNPLEAECFSLLVSIMKRRQFVAVRSAALLPSVRDTLKERFHICESNRNKLFEFFERSLRDEDDDGYGGEYPDASADGATSTPDKNASFVTTNTNMVQRPLKFSQQVNMNMNNNNSANDSFPSNKDISPIKNESGLMTIHGDHDNDDDAMNNNSTRNSRSTVKNSSLNQFKSMFSLDYDQNTAATATTGGAGGAAGGGGSASRHNTFDSSAFIPLSEDETSKPKSMAVPIPLHLRKPLLSPPMTAATAAGNTTANTTATNIIISGSTAKPTPNNNMNSSSTNTTLLVVNRSRNSGSRSLNQSFVVGGNTPQQQLGSFRNNSSHHNTGNTNTSSSAEIIKTPMIRPKQMMGALKLRRDSHFGSGHNMNMNMNSNSGIRPSLSGSGGFGSAMKFQQSGGFGGPDSRSSTPQRGGHNFGSAVSGPPSLSLPAALMARRSASAGTTTSSNNNNKNTTTTNQNVFSEFSLKEGETNNTTKAPTPMELSASPSEGGAGGKGGDVDAPIATSLDSVRIVDSSSSSPAMMNSTGTHPKLGQKHSSVLPPISHSSSVSAPQHSHPQPQASLPDKVPSHNQHLSLHAIADSQDRLEKKEAASSSANLKPRRSLSASAKKSSTLSAIHQQQQKQYARPRQIAEWFEMPLQRANTWHDWLSRICEGFIEVSQQPDLIACLPVLRRNVKMQRTIFPLAFAAALINLSPYQVQDVLQELHEVVFDLVGSHSHQSNLFASPTTTTTGGANSNNNPVKIPTGVSSSTNLSAALLAHHMQKKAQLQGANKIAAGGSQTNSKITSNPNKDSSFPTGTRSSNSKGIIAQMPQKVSATLALAAHTAYCCRRQFKGHNSTSFSSNSYHYHQNNNRQKPSASHHHHNHHHHNSHSHNDHDQKPHHWSPTGVGSTAFLTPDLIVRLANQAQIVPIAVHYGEMVAAHVIELVEKLEKERTTSSSPPRPGMTHDDNVSSNSSSAFNTNANSVVSSSSNYQTNKNNINTNNNNNNNNNNPANSSSAYNAPHISLSQQISVLGQLAESYRLLYLPVPVNILAALRRAVTALAYRADNARQLVAALDTLAKADDFRAALYIACIGAKTLMEKPNPFKQKNGATPMRGTGRTNNNASIEVNVLEDLMRGNNLNFPVSSAQIEKKEINASMNNNNNNQDENINNNTAASHLESATTNSLWSASSQNNYSQQNNHIQDANAFYQALKHDSEAAKSVAPLIPVITHLLNENCEFDFCLQYCYELCEAIKNEEIHAPAPAARGSAQHHLLLQNPHLGFAVAGNNMSASNSAVHTPQYTPNAQFPTLLNFPRMTTAQQQQHQSQQQQQQPITPSDLANGSASSTGALNNNSMISDQAPPTPAPAPAALSFAYLEHENVIDSYKSLANYTLNEAQKQTLSYEVARSAACMGQWELADDISQHVSSAYSFKHLVGACCSAFKGDYAKMKNQITIGRRKILLRSHQLSSDVPRKAFWTGVVLQGLSEIEHGVAAVRSPDAVARKELTKSLRSRGFSDTASLPETCQCLAMRTLFSPIPDQYEMLLRFGRNLCTSGDGGRFMSLIAPLVTGSLKHLSQAVSTLSNHRIDDFFESKLAPAFSALSPLRSAVFASQRELQLKEHDETRTEQLISMFAQTLIVVEPTDEACDALQTLANSLKDVQHQIDYGIAPQQDDALCHVSKLIGRLRVQFLHIVGNEQRREWQRRLLPSEEWRITTCLDDDRDAITLVPCPSTWSSYALSLYRMALALQKAGAGVRSAKIQELRSECRVAIVNAILSSSGAESIVHSFTKEMNQHKQGSNNNLRKDNNNNNTTTSNQPGKQDDDDQQRQFPQATSFFQSSATGASAFASSRPKTNNLSYEYQKQSSLLLVRVGSGPTRDFIRDSTLLLILLELWTPGTETMEAVAKIPLFKWLSILPLLISGSQRSPGHEAILSQLLRQHFDLVAPDVIAVENCKSSKFYSEQAPHYLAMLQEQRLMAQQQQQQQQQVNNNNLGSPTLSQGTLNSDNAPSSALSAGTNNNLFGIALSNASLTSNNNSQNLMHLLQQQNNNNNSRRGSATGAGDMGIQLAGLSRQQSTLSDVNAEHQQQTLVPHSSTTAATKDQLQQQQQRRRGNSHARRPTGVPGAGKPPNPFHSSVAGGGFSFGGSHLHHVSATSSLPTSPLTSIQPQFQLTELLNPTSASGSFDGGARSSGVLGGDHLVPPPPTVNQNQPPQVSPNTTNNTNIGTNPQLSISLATTNSPPQCLSPDATERFGGDASTNTLPPPAAILISDGDNMMMQQQSTLKPQASDVGAFSEDSALDSRTEYPTIVMNNNQSKSTTPGKQQNQNQNVTSTSTLSAVSPQVQSHHHQSGSHNKYIPRRSDSYSTTSRNQQQYFSATMKSPIQAVFENLQSNPESQALLNNVKNFFRRARPSRSYGEISVRHTRTFAPFSWLVGHRGYIGAVHQIQLAALSHSLQGSPALSNASTSAINDFTHASLGVQAVHTSPHVDRSDVFDHHQQQQQQDGTTTSQQQQQQQQKQNPSSSIFNFTNFDSSEDCSREQSGALGGGGQQQQQKSSNVFNISPNLGPTSSEGVPSGSQSYQQQQHASSLMNNNNNNYNNSFSYSNTKANNLSFGEQQYYHQAAAAGDTDHNYRQQMMNNNHNHHGNNGGEDEEDSSSLPSHNFALVLYSGEMLPYEVSWDTSVGEFLQSNKLGSVMDTYASLFLAATAAGWHHHHGALIETCPSFTVPTEEGRSIGGNNNINNTSSASPASSSHPHHHHQNQNKNTTNNRNSPVHQQQQPLSGRKQRSQNTTPTNAANNLQRTVSGGGGSPTTRKTSFSTSVSPVRGATSVSDGGGFASTSPMTMMTRPRSVTEQGFVAQATQAASAAATEQAEQNNNISNTSFQSKASSSTSRASKGLSHNNNNNKQFDDHDEQDQDESFYNQEQQVYYEDFFDNILFARPKRKKHYRCTTIVGASISSIDNRVASDRQQQQQQQHLHRQQQQQQQQFPSSSGHARSSSASYFQYQSRYDSTSSASAAHHRHQHATTSISPLMSFAADPTLARHLHQNTAANNNNINDPSNNAPPSSPLYQQQLNNGGGLLPLSQTLSNISNDWEDLTTEERQDILEELWQMYPRFSRCLADAMIHSSDDPAAWLRSRSYYTEQLATASAVSFITCMNTRSLGTFSISPHNGAVTMSARLSVQLPNLLPTSGKTGKLIPDYIKDDPTPFRLSKVFTRAMDAASPHGVFQQTLISSFAQLSNDSDLLTTFVDLAVTSTLSPKIFEQHEGYFVGEYYFNNNNNSTTNATGAAGSASTSSPNYYNNNFLNQYFQQQYQQYFTAATTPRAAPGGGNFISSPSGVLSNTHFFGSPFSHLSSASSHTTTAYSNLYHNYLHSHHYPHQHHHHHHHASSRGMSMSSTSHRDHQHNNKKKTTTKTSKQQQQQGNDKQQQQNNNNNTTATTTTALRRINTLESMDNATNLSGENSRRTSLSSPQPQHQHLQQVLQQQQTVPPSAAVTRTATTTSDEDNLNNTRNTNNKNDNNNSNKNDNKSNNSNSNSMNNTGMAITLNNLGSDTVGSDVSDQLSSILNNGSFGARSVDGGGAVRNVVSTNITPTNASQQQQRNAQQNTVSSSGQSTQQKQQQFSLHQENSGTTTTASHRTVSITPPLPNEHNQNINNQNEHQQERENDDDDDNESSTSGPDSVIIIVPPPGNDIIKTVLKSVKHRTLNMPQVQQYRFPHPVLLVPKVKTVDPETFFAEQEEKRRLAKQENAAFILRQQQQHQQHPLNQSQNANDDQQQQQQQQNPPLNPTANNQQQLSSSPHSQYSAGANSNSNALFSNAVLSSSTSATGSQQQQQHQPPQERPESTTSTTSQNNIAGSTSQQQQHPYMHSSASAVLLSTSTNSAVVVASPQQQQQQRAPSAALLSMLGSAAPANVARSGALHKTISSTSQNHAVNAGNNQLQRTLTNTSVGQLSNSGPLATAPHQPSHNTTQVVARGGSVDNLGATTVESSPSHSTHSPSHSRHSSPIGAADPNSGANFASQQQNQPQQPQNQPLSMERQPSGNNNATNQVIGLNAAASQQQQQQQVIKSSITTHPLSSMAGSEHVSLQGSFGFPLVDGTSTNNLDTMAANNNSHAAYNVSTTSIPPSNNSINNNNDNNPTNTLAAVAAQAVQDAAAQQQQNLPPQAPQPPPPADLPQPPSSSTLLSSGDGGSECLSSPTVLSASAKYATGGVSQNQQQASSSSATVSNSSFQQQQQQQSTQGATTTSSISVTHASTNQRHKSHSPMGPNTINDRPQFSMPPNTSNNLVSPSGENIDEWNSKSRADSLSMSSETNNNNTSTTGKQQQQTTASSTAQSILQKQKQQQQEAAANLLKEQLEKERQEAVDKIVKLQRLTRRFLARKKTCLVGRYVSAQALTSSLIAAATSMDRISRYEFGWAPFA